MRTVGCRGIAVSKIEADVRSGGSKKTKIPERSSWDALMLMYQGSRKGRHWFGRRVGFRLRGCVECRSIVGSNILPPRTLFLKLRESFAPAHGYATVFFPPTRALARYVRYALRSRAPQLHWLSGDHPAKQCDGLFGCL